MTNAVIPRLLDAMRHNSPFKEHYLFPFTHLSRIILRVRNREEPGSNTTDGGSKLPPGTPLSTCPSGLMITYGICRHDDGVPFRLGIHFANRTGQGGLAWIFRALKPEIQSYQEARATRTSKSTAFYQQIHVLSPTFPSECIGAVEGLPPSTKEIMPSAPLPHPPLSSVLFSPPGTCTSSLDVHSARVIRVSPVVEGRQRWSGLAESEEVNSFDSWVSLLLLPLLISLQVAVEVTSFCLGDEAKTRNACEGHCTRETTGRSLPCAKRIQVEVSAIIITVGFEEATQPSTAMMGR